MAYIEKRPRKDGIVYRVQIRRPGKGSISATFPTRADALKWGREQEHRADRGQAIGGTRAKLATLIQHYRKKRAEARRPIKPTSNTHYMLAALEARIGETTLDRLGDTALAYAEERRAAGISPYTIYMELSALGTALRYACSLLKIVYVDQLKDVRPTLHHLGLIQSQTPRRKRRPSPTELRALLVELARMQAGDWADPQEPKRKLATTGVPMIDLLRLAIRSTMRRAELCRIVWPDLDVTQRTVLIRDRKHPRNKERNDVVQPLLGQPDEPLGDALEIIMRQPRPPEEARDQRIFPYQPGTISKYFKWACDAVGIENLRWHDMRHEGTSRLFEAGWDIPQVAMVTGHLDWRSLRIYTHLDPAAIARKPAEAKKP